MLLSSLLTNTSRLCKKALDKDPKATQYTYQYVLFITPYDPNIFGTKKAMDGAIYTFLDKSKYVLTTAYGKTNPIQQQI